MCKQPSSSQLVGLANGAPMSMIALQKDVGLPRSRTACGVDEQFGCAFLCPGVEDGLHDTPPSFDVVRTLKQRWIALHAIIDESFVACVRGRIEMFPVVELHCNTVHFDRRPWDLGAEPEGHAFFRLH